MDGPVAGQLGGTRDTGGWLTPILLTVAGDLLRIESDLFKTTLETRQNTFVWNWFPMKVCLTVRFENLCDGSLHIGSRVEATRGQRTPCPKTLHLNIGQLSRRELSLNANSWFLCYGECGVTEWRWWDGVVRTLPTPGLLGTSPDTDRLHLAVVGRELGAGQLRGAHQWYIHWYCLNILWRVSLFQRRQGPGLSNVLWSYLFCLRPSHVHTPSVR